MENVLIDLDTGVAKLIDFGLGRFFNDPDELIHSYRGKTLSFTIYILCSKAFLLNSQPLVWDRQIT